MAQVSSDRASSNLRLWRRRYVTVIGTVGGALILSLLIEMLVLNHLDGRRGWSLSGLALVFAPAVLLVLVAVVSWRVRLRGSFRELCEAGTPAEVRAVSRALQRNQPVPEGGSAIAQTVVDRNARVTAQGRHRFTWTYGLLAVVFAGEFFVVHHWWRWFFLVGAAGYVVLAVFARRGSTRLTANAASQGIYPTADR